MLWIECLLTSGKLQSRYTQLDTRITVLTTFIEAIRALILSMKDHSKPHHPSARHYSLDIKHLGVAHCLAKTVPIAAKLNDQMSEDAPRLPG